MGRLLTLIGSVLAIVNGMRLLVAKNCSSVSFDGDAGGRVMAAVCYPGSQGTLPAWVAAILMIGLGLILALVAIRPRSY